MRKGIFGGTFNPVHYGHLRAAEEVRDRARLDSVVFIPSGNPPLKDEDLIAASHRYEMTRRAVQANGCFEVSDIELHDREKSFTYKTLDRLRLQWPDDQLFLILGVDAFLDMPLWKNPDHIVGIIDFIVVTRPGYPIRTLSASPYLAEESRKMIEQFDAVPSAVTRPLTGEDGILLLSLVSGRRVSVVRATPLGISSTGIRRLIRAGRSIAYLVPEQVEAYIGDKGLYRG